jgi:hypothetical protein
MEELIKLVAHKAGIPEEAARVAVQTVLGHVKQFLPEPFGSQLEALLAFGGQQQPTPGGAPATKAPAGDDLSSALNMLGNLLGGQK